MRPNRILLFLAGILFSLGVICFLWGGQTVSMGIVELRIPSLSLFEHSEEKNISAEELLNESAKDMDISASLTDSVNVDKANLSDTLEFYFSFMSENNARLHFPGGDTCTAILNPLFESLENLKTASNNYPQRVHIIHYGDSQIEGDRISGYLRAHLQKEYGGGGPGLLPLVQNVGALSVSQSLSDTLTSYTAGGMLGQRASHKGYGAMAQFAHINTTNNPISLVINAQRVDGFKHVKLFASNIDILSARMNGNEQCLPKSENIQSLSWRLKRTTKRIQMDLSGSSDILGIYIDADSGVTVTNIPMRGSDGTFFTRIQRTEMSYMLNELNTRLIILEFGGNALPLMKDSTRIEKYGKGLARQIKHLQATCKDAAILVVGPADTDIKVNGELQTNPYLEPLIEEMQRVTLESGAIYWDMYRAMGGRNSMKVWADHQPAWAAADYIHFTRRGADQIADLLWRSLMIYRDYWNLTSNVGENN